jgi:hypothetical protein
LRRRPECRRPSVIEYPFRRYFSPTYPFLAPPINDTPTGRFHRTAHRLSSHSSHVNSTFTGAGGTMNAVSG